MKQKRDHGGEDAGFEPHALLPLTPAEFHILLALADGDGHGYAIMQEVERETGGALHLGPGTLYRTIKQLLTAGLIAEADERPDPRLDDERRRYYRLTAYGRQVGEAEAQRLARLVSRAHAKRLLPDWEQAPLRGGA